MWNYAYIEKDCSCFCLNYTNQTFTFISSKAVNISRIASLGSEVSTAIKSSVALPDN